MLLLPWLPLRAGPRHPPAVSCPSRLFPSRLRRRFTTSWQNDCMRLTLDHRKIVSAGDPQVARTASAKSARLSHQRPTRRLLAALSAAALAGSLAGCVGGTPSVNESGSAAPGVMEPGIAEPGLAPSQAAGPAAADQTGAGTPGTQDAGPLADTSGAASNGAAEAAATETVRQTVTDALGRLAAGTRKPATAQVSDALTGAGIAPGVLEVSQSRTPTGLEADAIEAAVLQGRDCVIGQVRDGAVAVTVLPVLASGKCFVGT